MKNNSGIRAAFNIRSQNFEPLRHIEQVIPQTAKGDASLRNTPSSKKSGFDVTEKGISSFYLI